MGKYDGYLLCSDLDGTLSNSEGVITKETCDAIRFFQENGGRFTFATGRLPYYLDGLKEYVIPNAPVITTNGACIYDLAEKAYLKKTYLPPEAYEALYHVLENYRTHLARFYLNSESGGAEFIFDEHFKKEAVDQLLAEKPDWFKIVYSGKTEEDTLYLQKHFINTPVLNEVCYFPRSWHTGLEMLRRGATKGNAVQEIKQMFRDEIHTAVCVGDFENDISMIESADIGYAVANALESVKRAADRITVSNNENAVAKVIEELG